MPRPTGKPDRRTGRDSDLFLPHLVAREPGPWEISEVEILDAAVNLKERKARVPRAYTQAQRLARMHELGHVKYSPTDWGPEIGAIISMAAARNVEIDPLAALRIVKMLEENRIDWLLWEEHGIDIRPTREALDWGSMLPPTEALGALHWVLQLAWTVLASRGLVSTVANPPPTRPLSSEIERFFDGCWSVLSNHHPDLATAVLRACRAVYADPTDATRNRAASELAAFFSPPPPPVPPPEKKQERHEQEEAKQQEQEREQQEEAEETGVGAPPEERGHFEVHDHTLGTRRPSMRITSRMTPQPYGTRIVYPHRYLIDKAVFGRRLRTEGGLMVDGSGSMHWKQDDLMAVLDAVPAINVGIYSGFRHPENNKILGRICVLAKEGRYARFDKRDEGTMTYNRIDIEALEMLARWPRPRFWLSDGLVAGGKHMGPYPNEEEIPTTTSRLGLEYLHDHGAIAAKANAIMRRYDILRVATVEECLALFRRQAVTLYRSCVSHNRYYPPEWPEQAVRYQL